MKPIPKEIIDALLKQQTEMGWPDYVPAYASLPNAAGHDLYYRHQDLTVALCEQLVEHHSRTARLILDMYAAGRFTGGRASRKAGDAARHILMARLYRCRYMQLLDQQGTTEDDMPFAHNRW